MARALFPAHLADITFLVGNDLATRRTFSAIRNHLRAESPAFDRMLSGHWAEGHDNKPVELPDDDPEALDLLLKILHHRVSASSGALPATDTIFALAEFAEKYDLVALVRQSLEIWVTRALANDPACFEFEELCFMGYKFGLEEVFSRGFKDLAEHAYMANRGLVKKTRTKTEGTGNEKKLISGVEKMSIEFELLHDGAEDHIKAAREVQILKLNEAVQRFVYNKVLHGVECMVEQGTDASDMCESYMLGVLIECMQHVRMPVVLYGPMLDSEESRAATSQRLSVETMRCRLRNGLRRPTQPGHEQCLPYERWDKIVDEALTGEALIPERITEHLRRFDK